MANSYTRTTVAGTVLDTWVLDTDGDGDSADHQGGPATVGTDNASTMSAGTLSFEWSPDGGTTWVSAGTAITDPTVSAQNLTLAPGKFRPVLASVTGAVTVFRR